MQANVSWAGIVALLTGMLWVMGALLHWYNIRRQEQLIARLRRLSPRRRAAVTAEVVEAEPEGGEGESLAEAVRPSKRWTVG
jgi:hypothetical protein